MPNFDSKIFNGEVFGKYVERVPDLKRNELLKSGALRSRSDLKTLFSEQTGSHYATVPMFGRIGGDALNYDGNTDITATSTTTYQQSMIVVGRAKGWVEKDFSTDITGGVDFMSNVANQVGKYWDNIDQDILLAVLNGIFSMTGAENLKFVKEHTLDVSANGDGKVNETTLNTATQQACGDNKNSFSLVIMHSAVSTNLENLNLVERLKYTDTNGIQRELNIGTWNGKTVIMDDSMPAIKKGSSGPDAYTEYHTYVLGNGAIDFVDVGATVPYEMARDPKTNGGQTTLYSRQRKVFAPYGISFTKKTVASFSPTNDELKNGGNWELVKDSAGTERINHKAIPIARIISRG